MHFVPVGVMSFILKQNRALIIDVGRKHWLKVVSVALSYCWMSSDDAPSWHNSNKILLSMLLGNLSHLNPSLIPWVLSAGCWVCARDGCRGAPGAVPCPHGKGLPVEDSSSGWDPLWAPLLLVLIKHPVTLGSSRAINLNVLAKFQPA